MSFVAVEMGVVAEMQGVDEVVHSMYNSSEGWLLLTSRHLLHLPPRGWVIAHIPCAHGVEVGRKTMRDMP